MLFFFFGYTVAVQSQNTHHLSGRCVNAGTHEAVALVSIYEDSTNTVVYSDSLGYYDVEIMEGAVHFMVSYIGLLSVDTSFYMDKDVVINFYLKPSNIIKEVKVIGQVEDDVVSAPQNGVIHIDPKLVVKLPSLGGEADVIKALQYLPGVQSGTEGRSGLYVRGGSPDQNLIMIDGVPMYNISHLGDLFSVFNGDAIEEISLLKGSFPARYGGRLSSVLDIKMKTGSKDSLRGVAGIGMISSRITLDGPIRRGKSSFVFSARRSYPDLIILPIKKWDEGKGGINGRLDTWKLHFSDVYAKTSFRLNRRNKIDVFGFFNSDIFAEGYTLGDEDSFVTDTYGNIIKNNMGAVQWGSLLKERMNILTTVSFVRYSNQVFSNIKENIGLTDEEIFDTYIQDWTVKSQMTWKRPNKLIRFGLEGIHHEFMPGRYSILNDTVISGNPIAAIEGNGFVENDWTLGKLRMNLGLRLSYYRGQGSGFVFPEPRMAFRYMVSDRWSVKASYSNMVQYVNQNSLFDLFSMWSLSSGKGLKPQKSNQFAIGAVMKTNGYELSLDGYYKQMKGVLTNKGERDFFKIAQNWEGQLEQGKGQAYGAEIFVNKKRGNFSGWIGYALSWNWRQFDAINEGKRYPFHFDRRHELKLVLNYDKSKRVSFSGVWVFGTGNAVTLPIGVGKVWYSGVDYSNKYYQYNTQPIYIYSKKNALREPVYHRLDLSVSLKKEKKRGVRAWGFGLYNAYARANPFFLYVDSVYVDDANGDAMFDHRAIFRKTLFSVVPSISYTFTIK